MNGRTIRDKLVEVRRANGITEYVETNQLALEQFQGIERCEIVETYRIEFEILGREVFIADANIAEIIIVYSHLCYSYHRLFNEIKNLTLLDATTKQIEREYLLRSVLDLLREEFPQVFWDRSVLGKALPLNCEDLLRQICEAIPSRSEINANASYIIPYQR